MTRRERVCVCVGDARVAGFSSLFVIVMLLHAGLSLVPLLLCNNAVPVAVATVIETFSDSVMPEVLQRSGRSQWLSKWGVHSTEGAGRVWELPSGPRRQGMYRYGAQLNIRVFILIRTAWKRPGSLADRSKVTIYGPDEDQATRARQKFLKSRRWQNATTPPGSITALTSACLPPLARNASIRTLDFNNSIDINSIIIGDIDVNADIIIDIDICSDVQ